MTPKPGSDASAGASMHPSGGRFAMDVFSFVALSDPDRRERLGATLPDGRIVDLQAAHFSMTGTPSPLLASPSTFRFGGPRGAEIAEEVVRWIESEHAPGTTLPMSDAELHEAIGQP